MGDDAYQAGVEYEQAKDMLDGHMQYAHGGAARATGGKKPEKFRRSRSSGSSTPWLALISSDTQTALCLSDELKQSLSRSTRGRQFNL